MNEIDLIKEVEKRPILYDKSVSGFNKTKLRDEAWKDVQEALNVSGNVVTTEAECKKRWRSLRDSFIKLQRTHGGRTRWPYHYAMRFLLPHVEPKCENTDQPTTNEGTKHAERDLNYRHFSNCFVSPETQLEDPNAPAETKSEISNKREADDSDAEEEMRQRQIQALPDLSFPESKYEEEDESRSQPSPKKARLNSVDEENPCLCNRTDPDELFLLSCAPTLKRLNAKQNAVARLKIQQVLYEAEFGHQMELPYVTPASECSFDNIEGSVG